MSGIYIPGMEMPKGCAFCKISRRNSKKMICPFIWKCEWDIHDPMSADHRLDDCPLIPVPDHGRLIDADALKAKQQEDADLFVNAYTPMEKSRRDEALNAVANIVNAPTIIPGDLPVMYYPQVDGITPTIIPASKEGEG